MRILFFTHYFPPEVNAPAVRTHEHCKRWVEMGNEVHVVTCQPSHPAGVPFKGYRRRWYQREVVDGIVVHRVWTYLAANKGTARRVANYLSYVPTSVFRALRLGKFDVIVATSPQFFCAVAGATASKLKRTPWVMEVRDLWPESIPAVGAMKPSRALRALEGLAHWMYKDAAHIVCVTRSFIQAIGKLGIPDSKMTFVPNGIDPEFWKSDRRDEERAALGYKEDDVVVSFIGTLGMAHGLGTVLDAAAELKTTHPQIKFLLVGDGADAEQLKGKVAQQALRNVTLAGLVRRNRVPGLMAASDIALVSLKPSPIFETVLPSKMFEAMAAGKAVALAVDGEARRLLHTAGAGLFVNPGDISDMVKALAQLAGDRRLLDTFGRAGKSFVTSQYTRDKWASAMITALAKVQLLKTRSERNAPPATA